MRFEAPPLAAWKRVFAWLPLLIAAPAFALGGYVAAAPAHVSYTIFADDLVVDAGLGAWDMGRTASKAEISNPRVSALTGGHRRNGTGRGDLCEGDWIFEGVGAVWLAGTCGADAVLLDVGGETWALTPAEPAAFLAALGSGTGTFEPAAGAPNQIGWLVPAVLLPAVGILLWLGFRIAQPLAYRVNGGALEVPGNLKTVSLPLAGATFQQVALGRVWRVAGTALPGLLLGRFRADGRWIHMASRDATTGVRVTSGDGDVYVTPADLPGFCAALAAAGARRG